MAAIKNTSKIEELKKMMEDSETTYHASFKTGSCKAIMDSYYAWQYAKKKYYTAIGVCRPSNKDLMDEIADNAGVDDEF